MSELEKILKKYIGCCGYCNNGVAMTTGADGTPEADGKCSCSRRADEARQELQTYISNLLDSKPTSGNDSTIRDFIDWFTSERGYSQQSRDLLYKYLDSYEQHKRIKLAKDKK